MNKKLKAFTLIELIIVMAIMTILLVGIMRLFEPVRDAYQHATLYDTKRTVCNSINKYLTEGVRYAYFLGAYDATDAPSAVLAAQELYDAIAADTALAISDDDLKSLGKAIQVIEINYDNDLGRLKRYKDFTHSGTGVDGRIGTARTDYTAFGDAYYGGYFYTIRALYKNGTFAVTASTSGINNYSDPDDHKAIITSGGVVLNNIKNTGVGGKIYGDDNATYTDTALTDDFDYVGATSASGPDGIPDVLQGKGTINSGSGKYFIVYINAQDIPF